MKQKTRTNYISSNLILISFDVHEVLYIVFETYVALKNILVFTVSNGTRGWKIVTTYMIFFDNAFFQNSYRNGDRRLRQDAVLEGTVPIKKRQNNKTRFWKKNSQNQRSLRHGQSPVAKSDPPGGGPNPDCLIKFLKFVWLVCCQSSVLSINSSVASRPYIPHLKDCTGLE